VDVLAAFAAKQGITYTLFSDQGSKLIRDLGLLNEHVYEHHAAYGIPKRDHHWGVPYPGVFLLDAEGRVTQKRFQQSYRERETGVAVLERGLAWRAQRTARRCALKPRAFGLQRVLTLLPIAPSSDCG